ncbi:MAG: hypothetical protein N2234_09115 [Planctomycetota bacterium]|nr:hypothetical protein [Planctomycetota bacterium]
MRVVCLAFLITVSVTFLHTEEEKLNPEERAAVNKFYRLKLKEAELSLKKGDFTTAKSILQAMAVLGTDDLKLRAQIKELESLAVKEEVRAKVVDARLVVEKPVFSGVKEVRVFVRLINRSDETVSIFHRKEKGRAEMNAGCLSVLCVTYGANGTISSSEHSNLRFTKTEQVTLRKGEMWEKELSLEVPTLEEEEMVTYVYTLRGFVILEVLCGSEDVYALTLDLGRLSFKLVPKGAERYAEMPLDALVSAVKKAASKPSESEAKDIIRTIFFAPFFLEDVQKAAALPVLITWLPQLQEKYANAVTATLSYLTNLPFGRDRNRWVEWWKDAAKTR